MFLRPSDDLEVRPLHSAAHTPLLHLLVPLITAILAAHFFELRELSLWLIAGGCLLAAMSLGPAQKRPWAWAALFWPGAFVLLLGYVELRDRPLPETSPIAREVRIEARMLDPFATKHERRVFGLAKVTGAPPHLAVLRQRTVLLDGWLNGAPPQPWTGSTLRLRGRLHALQPADDFDTSLLLRGVYWQVDEVEAWPEQPANWLARVRHHLREGLRENLLSGARTAEQERRAELIYSMLLGEKSALRSEDKENFIATGTMHLFAVSGLHVGIIAALVAWALKWMQVGPDWRAGIGLPLVFLYVWLCGFPPSALRAFSMVALFWMAASLGRKPMLPAALAGSALLVLLWQPQQLFAPGFQLSYLVVAGIIFYGLPLGEWLNEKPSFQPPPRRKWLRNSVYNTKLALGVSFSATLAGTPLVAFYFGTLTPAAFVLNLALIPAATALLWGAVGILLLAPLLQFTPLLAAGNAVLGGIAAATTALIQLAANAPLGFHRIDAPSPGEMLAGVAALLAAFAIVHRGAVIRPLDLLLPPASVGLWVAWVVLQ